MTGYTWLMSNFKRYFGERRERRLLSKYVKLIRGSSETSSSTSRTIVNRNRKTTHRGDWAPSDPDIRAVYQELISG